MDFAGDLADLRAFGFDELFFVQMVVGNIAQDIGFHLRQAGVLRHLQGALERGQAFRAAVEGNQRRALGKVQRGERFRSGMVGGGQLDGFFGIGQRLGRVFHADIQAADGGEGIDAVINFRALDLVGQAQCRQEVRQCLFKFAGLVVCPSEAVLQGVVHFGAGIGGQCFFERSEGRDGRISLVFVYQAVDRANAGERDGGGVMLFLGQGQQFGIGLVRPFQLAGVAAQCDEQLQRLMPDLVGSRGRQGRDQGFQLFEGGVVVLVRQFGDGLDLFQVGFIVGPDWRSHQQSCQHRS